ncbi:unnamed protein product, partial [Linum tenue]
LSLPFTQKNPNIHRHSQDDSSNPFICHSRGRIRRPEEHSIERRVFWSWTNLGCWSKRLQVKIAEMAPGKKTKNTKARAVNNAPPRLTRSRAAVSEATVQDRTSGSNIPDLQETRAEENHSTEDEAASNATERKHDDRLERFSWRENCKPKG